MAEQIPHTPLEKRHEFIATVKEMDGHRVVGPIGVVDGGLTLYANVDAFSRRSADTLTCKTGYEDEGLPVLVGDEWQYAPFMRVRHVIDHRLPAEPTNGKL